MSSERPDEHRTSTSGARHLLKRCAFAICVPLVLPLVLACKVEQAVSGGEASFLASAAFLGLFPGHLGSSLRLAFYRFTVRRCSLDVHFNFGSTVCHVSAEIGANVSVGAHASIGTATIGDDVLIGPRASILSGIHQHDMTDGVDGLTDGRTTLRRVHIGAHSWIGEGAIVGADIGARCIVAAGSVVFRPATDEKLIIGNPARAVPRDFSERPMTTEANV